MAWAFCRVNGAVIGLFQSHGNDAIILIWHFRISIIFAPQLFESSDGLSHLLTQDENLRCRNFIIEGSSSESHFQSVLFEIETSGKSRGSSSMRASLSVTRRGKQVYHHKQFS